MSDIFATGFISVMNQKINRHTGESLKRQAKKIGKQENIPHYQALEKAAIIAGFNNWKHFLNSSQETSFSIQKFETRKLELKSIDYLGSQKKINPYRNLLVAAINELLKNELISLNSKNDAQSSKNGHFFFPLLGFPSVILWQDIGYEELRISVWWKYDHSNHPQANLTGNSRENFTLPSPLAKKLHYKKFVGVVASGWLERKTGKYVQGKNSESIFDVYTRKGEKAELEKLPIQKPNNFKIEGKFYI